MFIPNEQVWFQITTMIVMIYRNQIINYQLKPNQKHHLSMITSKKLITKWNFMQLRWNQTVIILRKIIVKVDYINFG